MKERPIIFSGPMVRAILAGRKTQTRRVIKPQPPQMYGVSFLEKIARAEYPKECPYGQRGDVLWVRETWADIGAGEYGQSHIVYRATYSGDVAWAWKPSIHMPRRSSRITLEVTGVRVERVQEITYEDAEAEGINPSSFPCECDQDDCIKIDGSLLCDIYPPVEGETAIPSFAILWDSINSKRGFVWDANPFVWVVEFKRLEAPNGQ